MTAVARKSVQASLLNDEERVAHRKFVATLGEKAIWLEYLKEEALPAAE